MSPNLHTSFRIPIHLPYGRLFFPVEDLCTSYLFSQMSANIYPRSKSRNRIARRAQPCLGFAFTAGSVAPTDDSAKDVTPQISVVENGLLIITDVNVCRQDHKFQEVITWTRGSCNASAPYPELPYGRSTVLGTPAYPPAWLGGYVFRVQKPCEAREQKCEYNRRLDQPFHFESKD